MLTPDKGQLTFHLSVKKTQPFEFRNSNPLQDSTELSGVSAGNASRLQSSAVSNSFQHCTQFYSPKGEALPWGFKRDNLHLGLLLTSCTKVNFVLKALRLKNTQLEPLRRVLLCPCPSHADMHSPSDSQDSHTTHTLLSPRPEHSTSCAITISVKPNSGSKNQHEELQRWTFPSPVCVKEHSPPASATVYAVKAALCHERFLEGTMCLDFCMQ